jgi:hypothetical protein
MTENGDATRFQKEHTQQSANGPERVRHNPEGTAPAGQVSNGQGRLIPLKDDRNPSAIPEGKRPKEGRQFI